MHPLIVRVRSAAFRRLTNAQVMKLSPRKLREYANWLLTPEGAVDMLESIFHPGHRSKDDKRK